MFSVILLKLKLSKQWIENALELARKSAEVMVPNADDQTRAEYIESMFSRFENNLGTQYPTRRSELVRQKNQISRINAENYDGSKMSVAYCPPVRVRPSSSRLSAPPQDRGSLLCDQFFSDSLLCVQAETSAGSRATPPALATSSRKRAARVSILISSEVAMPNF